MHRFVSPRTTLAVAVGALAAAGAVTGAWAFGYLDAGDAPAATPVGPNAITAARVADILAAGSAKAGFQLKGLSDARYELVSADVSGPPEGYPNATAPSPFLVYKRTASKLPRGQGEIWVTQAVGRQGPASFGRSDEPKPEPLASSAPGFEVVRSEAAGAVALTGWTADRTYELVFYPPNPSDAEMLKLLDSFVN